MIVSAVVTYSVHSCCCFLCWCSYAVVVIVVDDVVVGVAVVKQHYVNIFYVVYNLKVRIKGVMYMCM